VRRRLGGRAQRRLAVLGIRPPADSPRVSRPESDSGVVRAGLEAGREAALAVLRPLVA
jgi:hypothetical protein